jgi:phosphoglycerate dehydrogenase-like enzyme
MAGAPRLRWIADSSGSPPHLDYQYALERGIAVTDCRRAFGPAVGEMALALYLAVMRDVVVHDRALHTPEVVEGATKALNHEASHRTIGFIGFGGIARGLLRFLAPFEPRLLIHDPFVPDDVIRAAGATPAGASDLLSRADAIFVLATPTHENRALLGPAELDLIRPQSVLLVISRAWLVDEAALIERLQAGRFRRAMDVYNVEPLPANHPYRSRQNGADTAPRRWNHRGRITASGTRWLPIWPGSPPSRWRRTPCHPGDRPAPGTPGDDLIPGRNGLVTGDA